MINYIFYMAEIKLLPEEMLKIKLNLSIYYCNLLEEVRNARQCIIYFYNKNILFTKGLLRARPEQKKT